MFDICHLQIIGLNMGEIGRFLFKKIVGIGRVFTPNNFQKESLQFQNNFSVFGQRWGSVGFVVWCELGLVGIYHIAHTIKGPF